MNRELFRRFEQAWRHRTSAAAFTFLDDRLSGTSYSFARLMERVDELGGRLSSCNLDKERPFAILLRSQELQVLHYLAALSSGLTPVILTPPHRKLNLTYYLETTRAVFERCHFSAAVTDLPDLAREVTCLDPFTLHVRNEIVYRARDQSATLNGSAFLQFSSGTTGIKRGVLVSDEAALAQIDAYSSAIGLDPTDCIVSWLPLYHDMGFMTSLNMALACGVHSVMLDPVDWVSRPGLYLQAFSRFRGTLGWNPNFAYAFMSERVSDADLREIDLSLVRGLVNCAEPVTKLSQNRFYERFRNYGLRDDVFWGCYAMAETTFAITHGLSTDPGYYDAGNVCVGVPLAGVDVRVKSEDGLDLGDRAIGELCVRSPFNMSGYYNNPSATAAAFRQGWYKTGDLGYKVGSRVYVSGRKKDLLIIAGVNVFPEDIEGVVSVIDGVCPGRVCAFSDFDIPTQTERAVILAETSFESDRCDALTIRIRQEIAARLQISHFDVHLVQPGYLIKSSAGKMARGLNHAKWQEARR